MASFLILFLMEEFPVSVREKQLARGTLILVFQKKEDAEYIWEKKPSLVKFIVGVKGWESSPGLEETLLKLFILNLNPKRKEVAK